ncbi:MAG: helix-turn-helix domain-containing protein [Fimbriiglobus sp.]
MTDILINDPQTVARLDSVACIFEWIRSMSSSDKRRFLGALIECTDDIQDVVVSMLGVLKDPQATPPEQKRALITIADALFPNPCEQDGQYGLDLFASESYAAAKTRSLANEVNKMNSQEESFAERLKNLMALKRISQQELSVRIGCSQPAISQMLSRMSRPQKRTILKLAESLGVHPRELWPDIEVAEMLDAVVSFEQDDYTMTAQEAESLGGKAKKNRPKLKAKTLPTRS